MLLRAAQSPVTGWATSQEQRFGVNHWDHSGACLVLCVPATGVSTLQPYCLFLTCWQPAGRGQGMVPPLGAIRSQGVQADIGIPAMLVLGLWPFSCEPLVDCEGVPGWRKHLGESSHRGQSPHPSILPPEDIFQSPLYQAQGWVRVS